jgi:hypothetical protein
MEMSEKLPPEVLIYVQKVKKYLTTNDETREYFEIETSGDDFFKALTELSHKNFEDTGEAELSLQQFEDLRQQVLKRNDMYGVFVSLGDLGLISMN